MNDPGGVRSEIVAAIREAEAILPSALLRVLETRGVRTEDARRQALYLWSQHEIELTADRQWVVA